MKSKFCERYALESCITSKKSKSKKKFILKIVMTKEKVQNDKVLGHNLLLPLPPLHGMAPSYLLTRHVVCTDDVEKVSGLEQRESKSTTRLI